jgi:hypothetical protein
MKAPCLRTSVLATSLMAGTLSPAAAQQEPPALMPLPVTVSLSATERFSIPKEIAIEIPPGQPDLKRIAGDLASLLRPALDVLPNVRHF